MTAGNVFFALCAIVSLVGALVTVVARNPIRGAVGLLSTIVGMAGLFLMLKAQFLAAIQLIVYAGAVVVLFVFVIMLLGPDAGAVSGQPPKARFSRVVGVLAAIAASAFGLLLLAETSAAVRLPQTRPDHGSVEAVGGLIFRKGLFLFELATVLLIVAVIGAIAVARGGRPARRATPTKDEGRRLFAGPLHPRDAGRPLGKEGV